MLLLLLSVFNLLGGRGLIPMGRIIFRAVLMPLAVAWHFDFDWYVLFAAVIGFTIWAAFGWGKYFAAFHGLYDPKEREQGWIDSVGEALYPYDGKKETNLARGTICMGLRGLYLMPFFVLMMPFNVYAPAIGLLMLLQGACYAVCRWVPSRHAVSAGEVLTGVLIAILAGWI